MFTPPHTSRGRSSKTTIIPLNGLFDNGVWHCNCRPRLPAARFEVKKQGPNTGKWFYTCQEAREEGCKFFLWDDLAKVREKRAVMSNSRTEPISDSRSPATPNKPPSATKTFEEHMRGTDARKLGAKAKGSEDGFNRPLYTGEEKRVAQASAEPFTPKTSLLETPRKSIRTNLLDTPGSKGKREVRAPLPTPNTTSSSAEDDVFSTSTASKGSIQYASSKTSTRSPSKTPTPFRFRDGEQASNWALASTAISQDYDLTEEIMDLLKGQNVDKDTTVKVRDVLNRHVLKSRGIARGREITREALKSKEARIAELQLEISSLETERELDQLYIQKLKG